MRRKEPVKPILRQLRIDHRSKRPVYVQLMDGIKRLVYRRSLDQGMRLPPVRALASALDIHANTVARAYRELDREGLLSARVGRGTFLSPDREHQNRSLEARIGEIERELRNRCVLLGLSEKQFLRYVRSRAA